MKWAFLNVLKIYKLLIVKMLNLLGLIRCWPPANYVSSMHLPDPSDCINFSAYSVLSHLHCSVACSNISSFELNIMHSYIAVMKRLRLEQLAHMSWNVSDHVLHRLQPGITDHNGNKCNTVICNTCILCTLASSYSISILCSCLNFLYWINSSPSWLS